MLSPFFLLAEWEAAIQSPSMPGLALLEAQIVTEGEPHREDCACPDCDPYDSPMLED